MTYPWSVILCRPIAVQKGLRLGSVRSYRDTPWLFLCFVTEQTCDCSTSLRDLSFDRVLCFLKHLARPWHRAHAQSTPGRSTRLRYLALQPERPPVSKSPRFR